MSKDLADYAAAALSGVNWLHYSDRELLATMCFEMAEAMMAEHDRRMVAIGQESPQISALKKITELPLDQPHGKTLAAAVNIARKALGGHQPTAASQPPTEKRYGLQTPDGLWACYGPNGPSVTSIEQLRAVFSSRADAQANVDIYDRKLGRRFEIVILQPLSI